MFHGESLKLPEEVHHIIMISCAASGQDSESRGIIRVLISRGKSRLSTPE
jgi:hypothetical protein